MPFRVDGGLKLLIQVFYINFSNIKKGKGVNPKYFMIWIILIAVAIAVAIAAVVAVCFLVFRKKAELKSTVAFSSVECSRATHQTTAKGAHVYSVAGLPKSSLTIIDQGLDRVFADAAVDGYTKRVGEYDFFQIYIPVKPCTLSPVQRCPSFEVVGGSGYDGSIYDIDPRPGFQTILAAEMVINQATGEFIVCPDLDILFDDTRWGTEHCLIWANDPEYDAVSQNHASGQYVHPLLPRGAER